MWLQAIYVFGSLSILLCCAADETTTDAVSAMEKYLFEYNNENENDTKVDLCDHESGKEAQCVKISRCQVEKLDDDNDSRIILRSIGCLGYLEVCCPIDNIITKVSDPPQATLVGCGHSNPGAAVLRDAANIYYDYADFAEFRWMIMLLSTDTGSFKNIFMGEGTLIHPSVVITAAHKVEDIKPEKLKCRAGEWDITSTEEMYKHQDRDVKNIIIHEKYLKNKGKTILVYNDVALIDLKEPFELEGAPHIGLACLEPTLPSPSTECYSMGWGEDIQNDSKYANILKKLPLRLVDGKKCEKSIRKKRRSYKLHKSLTCAGGEANVDTCIGDGGSSLVCPINDTAGKRYAVVGMVAYGLGCGKKNMPGVYVNIPEVYQWVVRKMTTLGFNERPYEY